MTGIRAAAALWVLLFHMKVPLLQMFPQYAPLINFLAQDGYLGVDLFFILSGFIIYYNYAAKLARPNPSGIVEFLWMRLARLWPVHVALLFFCVGFLGVQHLAGRPADHPELHTWSGFVRNLFLVHGWSIPLKVSWNAPAWSISCEWLAYLMFPFILHSRLCTTSVRLSAGVAAVGLVGTACLCQSLHDVGYAQFGLVRIVGEFLAGCCLCHIFRTGAARPLPWEYIVPIVMAAGFFASYFFLHPLGLMGYWCVPLLGLVVLGLAHERGLTSRFFSSRLLLWGGSISYSFYMVHWLCLTLLSRLVPHLGKWEPLLAFLAITIASAFMFHCVEEPCRKQMRRMAPAFRSRPASLVPPVPPGEAGAKSVAATALWIPRRVAHALNFPSRRGV